MFRKTLLSFLLICCWVTSQALYLSRTETEEWENFKNKYVKVYRNNGEENHRRNVFVSNLKKINEHNELYEQGEKTFTMKINKFGDMTPEEFKESMNGFEGRRENSNANIYVPEENELLPASVDWRTKGAVTGVKCQALCLSSWAFSVTGSLEGQTFLKTGKLVSLSEQNLIDCSRKYNNSGCAGGLLDSAFQYIKDNKGIDTEESYPYEAEDNKCRFKKGSVGAAVKSFTDIKPGSESDLQSAVAKIGPISVAIDAEGSFQFYSSGLYHGEDCNPSRSFLNHGVLAVGYGSSSKGDYWIVKNSWSEEWGDKGYILMSRNKKNNCGIATYASFPVV